MFLKISWLSADLFQANSTSTINKKYHHSDLTHFKACSTSLTVMKPALLACTCVILSCFSSWPLLWLSRNSLLCSMIWELVPNRSPGVNSEAPILARNVSYVIWPWRSVSNLAREKKHLIAVAHSNQSLIFTMNTIFLHKAHNISKGCQ